MSAENKCAIAALFAQYAEGDIQEATFDCTTCEQSGKVFVLGQTRTNISLTGAALGETSLCQNPRFQSGASIEVHARTNYVKK